MQVNHTFLVKRLFNEDEMFCLFSANTHHPFAYCTEDEGEDQLFLFADQALCKAKGEELVEQKYSTVGVPIKKEDNGRRKFFVDCYSMGFTQVSFTDDSGEQILSLKEIVDVEADLKKAPAGRRPMINRALQTTSLYFVQELNRKIPREENPALPDLMDELEYNLAKAMLIVVGSEVDDPKNPGKKAIGLVNLQDKEGRKFVAVYSDAMEFSHSALSKRKDYRVFPTSLKMLRAGMKEADSMLMLNPESIQLRLSPKLVDRILSRLPASEGEEKK